MTEHVSSVASIYRSFPLKTIEPNMINTW